MISSFLGLLTSRRGLLAQQQALDVAAHNVANANTVGYTRQEATLGAADPLHLTAGATQNGTGAFLGQGVDVTAYRRVRDSFLDLQVRAQNMALGEGSTSAQALDNVQSAIGEPSTTASTRCWASSTRPGATWPTTRVRQLQAGRQHRRQDAGRRLRQPGRPAPERRHRRHHRVQQHHRAPPARSRRPPPARAAQQGDLRRRPGRAEPQRPARPSRPDPRRPQPVRAGLGHLHGQRPDLGHARQPVGRHRLDGRLAGDAGLRLRPRRRSARRAEDALHHHDPRLPQPARRGRQDDHDDVNAAYGASFFAGTTAATLGTGIPAAASSSRPVRAGTPAPAPTTSPPPSPRCATRARPPPSTARSCARSARPPQRHPRASRSPRPPATPPRIAARTSRAVARRGDGQHAALPARLPGLGPRDVDHRRHARHADQPRRTGGAVVMRVTTGMSQRHVLTDLRRVQERRRAPRARSPAASASRSLPTIRWAPSAPCASTPSSTRPPPTAARSTSRASPALMPPTRR